MRKEGRKEGRSKEVRKEGRKEGRREKERKGVPGKNIRRIESNDMSEKFCNYNFA